MDKIRMELLRGVLNYMIVSEGIDDLELLKMSQDMDKLILQSVKESNFAREVLGERLMKEFDIIVDKLQLFEKMYERMRIVDPVGKKVLEIKGEELLETNLACYEFWQRQMLCENCISMRAYNEDDVIFKIEPVHNELYMVTAVPVEIHEKKLIVELIKNATNSMYMASGKIGDEIKVLSTFEHVNQAAVKDELTGLYNRRYINERLPVDLLNSSVKNEPLSIIFADLDFFKAVNDTYGHSAGDYVLHEFSNELRNQVRSEKDWIARYGGEEFLICLPDTNYEAAKTIAERIRKIISEKVFTFGNKQIHLTCSFGVHTICDEKECMTIDGIIELADKKLYQAKREGRNKVV